LPLDDRKILVVGATGFLGQPVVWSLDHFGFPIRIFSRNRDKAVEIFGKHFDIAAGDIHDDDSLRRALDGCYGVHINLKGGPKPEDFNRIEHQGTARIVEAALRQGVKRITYLSGASLSRDRLWFPPTRAKYNAEQTIIKSGLEYGIFRATWFMESLPLFVKGKQAIIIGKQPEKIHWLAAEDYARMVAMAYMIEEPLKETFIVWGPDEYTFREALQILVQHLDNEIKVTNVPIWVLKLIATVTFTKQFREALPLMQYFEKNGELGDPEKTDNLLGHPQITLKDWFQSYKEQIKPSE
jgi:uncharacterized protein YbjT (DUF2867 family)